MSGEPTEMLRVEADEERDREIYAAGFIPGWIGEGGLRPEPLHDFLPARWSWRDGRRLLDAASRSIDPKVAERRNIRLANPADGKRTSLNTIHASYQMVAPGEFARAHRHTVNAARFILESDGAFTTLNGQKVFMEPNDIILTPNWVWHGLGNDNPDAGAYWIDFLDDPLVGNLKTIFFEVRDENYQDMEINDSSEYHIRWTDIVSGLERLDPDGDGGDGRRLDLPIPSIPTMELFAERVSPRSTNQHDKSTVNHIFICAEGEGTTRVGDDELAWVRGDVVVVPSWHAFVHQASTESVLLGITDRPVMEAFGWFRESR